MVFEYILKKNGIDPSTDLTIDQSINFGLTAAAFTSCDADYTVEFEPFATGLEKEGNGHVIASLGVDSGYVPYTAYSVKKAIWKRIPTPSEIHQRDSERPGIRQHPLRRRNRQSDPAPVKETDEDTIATIVGRYKDQDTWKDDTVFERTASSFWKTSWRKPANLTNAFLTTNW